MKELSYDDVGREIDLYKFWMGNDVEYDTDIHGRGLVSMMITAPNGRTLTIIQKIKWDEYDILQPATSKQLKAIRQFMRDNKENTMPKGNLLRG